MDNLQRFFYSFQNIIAMVHLRKKHNWSAGEFSNQRNFRSTTHSNDKTQDTTHTTFKRKLFTLLLLVSFTINPDPQYCTIKHLRSNMLSIAKAFAQHEELEELNPEPPTFLCRFKDHAAQHIHNAYEYVFICTRVVVKISSRSLFSIL